jgi:hypothetical protein
MGGGAGPGNSWAVENRAVPLTCVVLSVFGYAVAVLARSVAAALAITIGWILPAAAVLQGRPRTLDHWLLGKRSCRTSPTERSRRAAHRWPPPSTPPCRSPLRLAGHPAIRLRVPNRWEAFRIGKPISE